MGFHISSQSSPKALMHSSQSSLAKNVLLPEDGNFSLPCTDANWQLSLIARLAWGMPSKIQGLQAS